MPDEPWEWEHVELEWYDATRELGDGCWLNLNVERELGSEVWEARARALRGDVAITCARYRLPSQEAARAWAESKAGGALTALEGACDG